VVFDGCIQRDVLLCICTVSSTRSFGSIENNGIKIDGFTFHLSRANATESTVSHTHWPRHQTIISKMINRTLNTLRSVLTAESSTSNHRTAGYQAVSVGDESNTPDTRTRQETTRRHERKVFWCFWALGAGVLLSWNGELYTSSPTGDS
jgi:hypothetical protein